MGIAGKYIFEVRGLLTLVTTDEQIQKQDLPEKTSECDDCYDRPFFCLGKDVFIIKSSRQWKLFHFLDVPIFVRGSRRLLGLGHGRIV